MGLASRANFFFKQISATSALPLDPFVDRWVRIEADDGTTQLAVVGWLRFGSRGWTIQDAGGATLTVDPTCVTNVIELPVPAAANSPRPAQPQRPVTSSEEQRTTLLMEQRASASTAEAQRRALLDEQRESSATAAAERSSLMTSIQQLQQQQLRQAEQQQHQASQMSATTRDSAAAAAAERSSLMATIQQLQQQQHRQADLQQQQATQLLTQQQRQAEQQQQQQQVMAELLRQLQAMRAPAFSQPAPAAMSATPTSTPDDAARSLAVLARREEKTFDSKKVLDDDEVLAAHRATLALLPAYKWPKDHSDSGDIRRALAVTAGAARDLLATGLVAWLGRLRYRFELRAVTLSLAQADMVSFALAWPEATPLPPHLLAGVSELALLVDERCSPVYASVVVARRLRPNTPADITAATRSQALALDSVGAVELPVAARSSARTPGAGLPDRPRKCTHCGAMHTGAWATHACPSRPKPAPTAVHVPAPSSSPSAPRAGSRSGSSQRSQRFSY